MTDGTHAQPWPQRSWALGLLGAAIGALFYSLVQPPETPTNAAIAFGLVTGGISLALVLDRARLTATIAFAVVAALVAGFIMYWNVDGTMMGEEMRPICAGLAIITAVPLFQAWIFGGAKRGSLATTIPTEAAHEAAWSDMVTVMTSFAFALLCMLVTFLFSELFNLIGIKFIRELLGNKWFPGVIVGGAFGAAAGVLRDRTKMVSMPQDLLRTILSVLAPVVAIGLAIFLVASIFNGITSLWEETKATTPILIASFIVALGLANAVIGESEKDESKVGSIRLGARILGVLLLPIGLLAAYSTGLRIGQYGLTPDRIWAFIMTMIACAIGLGYGVSVIRGKAAWPAALREANVKLAIGICAVLMFLALPILNFTQISANDQVARLQSGKTPVSEFSWDAMRWHYGAPGKAALATLAKEGKTDEIRLKAAELLAIKDDERFSADLASMEVQKKKAAANIATRMTIKPTAISLPDGLKNALAERDPCGEERSCMLFYSPNASRAVLVWRNCPSCPTLVENFGVFEGQWMIDPDQRAEFRQSPNPFSSQKVELRDVPAQQVFVDGQPIGQLSRK